MKQGHTDLALEAVENFRLGTPPEGVSVAEFTDRGFTVTEVRVTDRRGAEALGKPEGRYVTVGLSPCLHREADFFPRAAACIAARLRALLPPIEGGQAVLVAGLGNRAMTADAVGPLTLESVLVTRHMVCAGPECFGAFTPVAAVASGVMADTGMEALELLHGAVQAVRPAAVIAVDALAARSRHRLCATVQLGDTGLIPGSGVGNHRHALNRETLGVPVIAAGVPTVIAALPDGGGDEPLFLTPRDIDSRVRELGRLLGYGITLALQPSLTVEDITGLLG